LDAVNISEMIFSEKYAKKSFNIHVDEWTTCMDALFDNEPFDEADKPESIGSSCKYETYSIRSGKQAFEVEHIWANRFDRHKDEFDQRSEFDDYRNCLGGLLLLPKSFNASYGDLPYEDKLQYYYSQNLLAQSLHPKCYERNPGFARYKNETGLSFRAHEQFSKLTLMLGTTYTQNLAERIWDPCRLRREAGL